MTTTDISALTAEEKRALLARLLAETPKTGASARPRSFPLSFAQERLWFVDRLEPESRVYTIPMAMRLKGRLDAARLARGLDAVVARHESLRTRFVTRDGVPAQVIDPPRSLGLRRETVANAQALAARLAALVDQPFDLEQGPLLRAALLAAGPEDHVLAVVVHHIAADYASLGILLREIVRLQADEAAPLPPLQIQYPDYAAWQRGRTADLDAELDYWRRELADAPDLLPLPTDLARPAVQSFEGARHAFALDRDLAAAIGRLARAAGATPFMVLLAAFQILLHRLSGADDICVGSTVSNRDRAELRDVVGLFVNNLVFRTRFRDDDSFERVLGRVRDTAVAAFAHQQVPFERVVDALEVPRTLSHNALFQAMFVLHGAEPAAGRLPGLDIAPVSFGNRAARFDIALDMYEGEHLTGVFEYRTDLFHAGTIDRLARRFVALLTQLTAMPQAPLGRLDLRLDDERAADARRNDTARALPDEDIATLIEARAAARGEAVAVVFEDEATSYADLDARANRLAAHLARHLPQRGGQPRIAVCLPRGTDLVVALLAVLKLGAAYIPLDPAHPPARLVASVEDGNAALMLVRDVAGTVPALALDPPCPLIDLAAEAEDIAALDPVRPARHVGPDDLAYAIFTSGSTGRPKGVPVTRRALLNLLVSMAEAPGMSEDDVLVAVTTPAFDIAALELLLPLLVGGKLVIAGPHVVYDDAELARLLGARGATMMQATPSTWRLLADGGWRAPTGFRMLCGGEALDPALARRLLAGRGELWNLYGPTETTIWSAAIRIRPEDADGAAVPIGMPITNTELHVLDRHLQPVPPGVVGELFIGASASAPAISAGRT
ncbi:non-ribosomal peptide synthetase [Methylobrevis pamukkalensis]|uniref:Linear gramicidin synthase subunit B n=1 Tax=Methylobrevis pamukkalensis TaxID=1439726 RepID=A0A1E3H7N6_9HYPH|nr:Linear gramicidin synthase subunit B [Methylobrevis pamukkalensis]